MHQQKTNIQGEREIVLLQYIIVLQKKVQLKATLGCFCKCVYVYDLPPNRPYPGLVQQLVNRTLCLYSTPSLDQEVDLKDIHKTVIFCLDNELKNHDYGLFSSSISAYFYHDNVLSLVSDLIPICSRFAGYS